ncbi:MAG TPA: discoidin domain-containing protein [Longimicrobiales bacterium]|nr:discoidin domain-containing protein [Longimicrobiales bacterium]
MPPTRVPRRRDGVWLRAGIWLRDRVSSRASSRAVHIALVFVIGGCASRGGAEPAPAAAPHVIDAFDDVSAWSVAPATGVHMELSADSGVSGGGLRVDFDFRGGGGWAAFRRDVRVRLPENYEIGFWLRGDAPPNTLELKLIDATGENVWWVNRPRFEFNGDWRRVTFRRRHVTFAWGPRGGGEIRDVRALELAITAGSGGRGTVWIDSITVTPREPVRPYDIAPLVTASSTAAPGGTGALIDDDSTTVWRSGSDPEQVVTLDFQRTREYGGLIVHWDTTARARDYDVDISSDGRSWQTVRAVRGGAGARDYLSLPESESRWLRLRLLTGPGDYALRGLAVQPIEWAESRNTLFETIAADAPPGHYPKYLGRVQSYWTLIGVSGAAEEALINEEGAVEVGKAAFSVEPFLHLDGRLITWADATVTQSLHDGYMPIPTVSWRVDDLHLDVTAWADGDPSASMLWLRYRVRNTGRRSLSPSLFLALRPFQVNPSWQFLNTPGGVTTIRHISYAGDVVTVDDRLVIPVSTPAAFGATSFDAGGVMRAIAGRRVPTSRSISDPFGHASAALSYELRLDPGTARDILVAVPLASAAGTPSYTSVTNRSDAEDLGEQRLAAVARSWRAELNRFDVELPAGAPPLGDLLRSNLAYVLINRDGPAIQPGSRSYERSWIRDGSLTSAALLRLGHEREVREFIEWFAPFQYDNGKVPCCVDARGADPVPEHDSHGQLIYLIAEYFRFTGDTTLVRQHWSNITRAVAHIDSLRHSRMTPVYRTADSIAYYGMVPQSISHEGYSAKPMHSYWDAFFVLRGLTDAAWLAGVLGSDGEQTRFAGIRDEFRRDLHASFARAMAEHGIDYLPGSVELGDFDATSTTVGITPAGELSALEPQMRATFDRYWAHFTARRDGAVDWDAYTPYELRVIGAFVRLGERRRAHEALDWFLRDVRPSGWNHWAEVVSRDRGEPRFIGDMPHGWVGSDFIRSVTDMFAHVREYDGALVIGAGVLPEWLEGGDTVRVRGLRTPHGTVGYTMRSVDAGLEIVLEPGIRVPDAGIVISLLDERPIRRAVADGREVRPTADGAIRLDRWPASFRIEYGPRPDSVPERY